MGGRKRILVMPVAAALLLVFLLGVPAQAANPESVNVSAAVAEALRLTVSKNTVDFGGSLLPDGGSGLDGVYTDTLVARVSANVPWRLEVDKEQDLTDGAYTIPSSRLTFTSNSGDYRVTATRGTATEFGTDVMVAEGIRGRNIAVSVDYRIDIEWEDPPSTYTANHIYTVVAR